MSILRRLRNGWLGGNALFILGIAEVRYGVLEKRLALDRREGSTVMCGRYAITLPPEAIRQPPL